MNTLDLYINHLKAKQWEAANSGNSYWAVEATNALNSAIDFGNKHMLTDEHLTEASRSEREVRVEAVVKELWLEKRRDSGSWAEQSWPSMSQEGKRHPELLELLEEAREIVAEEYSQRMPLSKRKSGTQSLLSSWKKLVK